MYRGGSAGYKDTREEACHQGKYLEMQMKNGTAGKWEEKLVERDQLGKGGSYGAYFEPETQEKKGEDL